MYRESDSSNNWTYYTTPDLPNPPLPEEPKPEKKKKKRQVGVGGIIIIALCCSLLGGALGAGGMLLFRNSKSASDPALKDTSTEPTEITGVVEGNRPNTIIDVQQVDTSKLMTPAEVYATNVNSAVGITTSITTNYWGYPTTSAAAGSGLILTEDGYILTNHHVIENSSAVTVSFFNGSSLPAKVIGYDASNDIAVLKVEATGLTPVTLGDSDNMNVGDQVIAIGNPLGELTFSLTSGVVSALDRTVTISNGVTMNLIQTDCAINSGNSGGPLFNLYGEMIGITNAKYSGNSASGASIDNIGFAIPLNNVRKIVESVIEKGYISKPYIGVSVTNVSEESQGYGMPQGASVQQIVEGSPAAEAGLQISDIITHVDGQAITGSSDLVKVVGSKNVGDVLKLTVFRKGQTLEVSLTVGENRQDAQSTVPSSTPQQTVPDGYSGNPFEDFFGGYGY